jgi:hypothetical protein
MPNWRPSANAVPANELDAFAIAFCIAMALSRLVGCLAPGADFCDPSRIAGVGAAHVDRF